ncbi:MAG TPA: thiamine pyrophosphate-dependent enzyme [Nevskiaceae bacterium]|nr:thiamine pyrophosphate-dependent enzyme [Nevskiaceae bacterium]
MAELTFSIEQRFYRSVRDNALPNVAQAWTLDDAGITGEQLIALFESQLLSRQLDLNARRMHAAKQGFYTIGSSGHEGNAAIAAALRLTDPAFLHYRDAAFFIQRSKQLAGYDVTRDLLLSFVASSEDPIAGGRHKVLGSKMLNVPPQTSTIASQFPKALGTAFSFALWKRLGDNAIGREWPSDSVVYCSFGDASFNHSTAQGAINAAAWTAYQNVPLPLLLVCEDNGLGVSTPTPPKWIEANMAGKPAIRYLACDGLNLLDTLKVAREAEHIARARRAPVFLHMRCVRLMGHAGADAQEGYLSAEQIEAQEKQDPLLYSARLMLDHDLMSAGEIVERYDAIGAKVKQIAAEVITRPKLTTAKEVMAAIVPPRRASRALGKSGSEPDFKKQKSGSDPDSRTTMAKLINATLDRLMTRYPQLVMAGEDIGHKGGVYGVTLKLQQRHGVHRVIDTLLDEQTILGLGIGLAQNGILPVVEIQYLAFLHNAEDQIRGEAATLSFFSQGQFTNPMVVRMAGLAYQKGFGGHFHNDNAIGVLRDIPGLLVACPSNGADAVGLLQECVRLADEEQRVVIFLEPIALYHTRDLLKEGDGLWSFADPGPDHRCKLGEIGIHGDGRDLAIVTYGNGVYLSRQAAPEIESEGPRVRIVDLRWLTSIDHDRVHDAVKGCKKILIVDECRRSASISEELITALVERHVPSDRMARITAEDSFIPLGVGATSTLPSKASIVAAARALLKR